MKKKGNGDQKQINKNKEKEKRRDHKGTLVPFYVS